MDGLANFWGPHNFGMLPREYSNYESARVCVLPVPYESTTCYRTGTAMGPAAIVAASMNMELYDEELEIEPFRIGIHTTTPFVPSKNSVAEALEDVEKVVRQLAEEHKFPVILGGEHSISLGCVRALKRTYPDLSVLQIDAHADLRDAWEGTALSHACVMRRIIEVAPAVQVGIRSMTREEQELARSRSLKIVQARELAAARADEKRSLETILAALSPTVYLTIDADGLDPSIMPAVGTPEPGGLGWYQTLSLIREVVSSRHVVGFDFVELCPIAGNLAPDFLAARLVYKTIGYIFEKEVRRRPDPASF
jgi:agmatinase